MDKKSKFYEITKEYFDSGIFDEIYSSEELSICNVSNHAYLIFCFETLQKGVENFGGFCINNKVIPDIVDDNKVFYSIIAHWNPEQRKNAFVKISNNNLKKLWDLKKQTDMNGPSKSINFEMEAEIKSKNKKL